jgi:ankyrin repeat protein
VRLLLAHPEIRVNEKDSNEDSALIVAAKNGGVEIAKLLLANPDIRVNEK